MNLEQLQRFLVLADCLNFTLAAEKLYVGQSTISRQIAALEQDLGVQLLIRGARSVELTEAGKVLQYEGKQLLDYVSNVKAKVVNADRGTAGELRINTIPASFSCISEIYVHTLNIYPNLTVYLSFSKHPNVCLDLDNGTADFAVTYSFLAPHNDAYESIVLSKSIFYVLCRKGHWIAQHPEGIYRESLQNEDIIFGRKGLILNTQSHHSGVPSAADVRGNRGMENDLLAIQTSNKIMVLPGESAVTGKNLLAQIPLLDKDLEHTVLLIYRKDSVNNTMMRFLEVVQTYLRDVSHRNDFGIRP